MQTWVLAHADSFLEQILNCKVMTHIWQKKEKKKEVLFSKCFTTFFVFFPGNELNGFFLFLH